MVQMLRRLSLIGSVIAAAMLLATPSALAGQDASVRVVHAVPGVDEVSFEASGTEIGNADFGEATERVEVPAGKTKLVLNRPGGESVRATERLEPGVGYTVVAMAVDGGAELQTFENEEAKGGVAKLRMIHASPELGEPDITVGDTELARDATFTSATSYETFKPGRYELTARNPDSGEAAVPAADVPLAAGTSASAVLVGSAGERTRIVMVDDATAAPATGPNSGFGGLAGNDSAPVWPLALLAALLAGTIGGLAHWALTAPRGRAGLGDG